MKTILVFPIHMDEVKPFTQQAKSLGNRIIGATSVKTIKQNYRAQEDFFYLPYITEPEFETELIKKLEQHSITHIWTPLHAIWSHINNLSRKNHRLQGILIGKHPFAQNWENFAESFFWGKLLNSDQFSANIAPDDFKIRNPLYSTAYASIHRGYLRIPGESDLDKLRAICSLCRIAPTGDIIEIGSLYGRSAYALGRLAFAHNIGSCICVDPWSIDFLNQGNKASVIEDGFPYFSFDNIFTEFLAVASEVPGLSYIRQPSCEAAKTYQLAASQGVLRAQEVSPVKINGIISILHIDGNHRLDQVRIDVLSWLPFVAPGGWIMLDDYDWLFGDGPKIVGDDLLKTKQFDLSFCLSDTLFLRKRNDNAPTINNRTN